MARLPLAKFTENTALGKAIHPMKPTVAYGLGAIGFLICLAIGIYYIIPLSTAHLFSDHGANYSDTKHALVFFGLAIVCLIAARFVANAKAR